MSLSKKIFIFSTSLFLLVLVLGGIYFTVFRKEPKSSDVDRPVIEKASRPASQSEIAAVLQDEVGSAAFSPSRSSLIYYSPSLKAIYRADLDGKNPKSITVAELPALKSISWSPDANSAVLGYQKEGRNIFSHYSFDDAKMTSLKENLDTVSWQTPNRILYKYFNPRGNERSLNISDPDGKNWLLLSRLPYRYLSLSTVPHTGLVSFWNSPDAFAKTSFETVPAIGGEKKTIFENLYGADYLWSPDGNHVLISSTEDKGGSKIRLAVANSNGGEYNNLNIPTFVSKCVWSKDGKTVYYALPGSLPENIVLPNDYLAGELKTVDTFWKVDITTGEKSRIVDLSKIQGQFDASNLFLNTDESVLFFINQTDSKLYRIAL